jgi:hypothetical protein
MLAQTPCQKNTDYMPLTCVSALVISGSKDSSLRCLLYIRSAPVNPATFTSDTGAEWYGRLKRGSDATSHAGRIVGELCVSAQVANNKLFEQSSAEPVLSWRRNPGTTAFFPI